VDRDTSNQIHVSGDGKEGGEFISGTLNSVSYKSPVEEEVKEQLTHRGINLNSGLYICFFFFFFCGCELYVCVHFFLIDCLF
jgi:hypothetical protein